MSSFSVDALWRALSDAHDPPSRSLTTLGSSSILGQAWTRTPGPAGVDDGWSFGRTKLARVMRLRHAIEDSLPLAFEELQRLLGAVSFAKVRQVLVTLVRDIALVWCGSVILGGGLGGVIGAFGAGLGAVPGAAIGASVGASAGEALLALFGLKALAESMAASMPRALRAYQQGARDAWDDAPFHDADDGHESFRTRQAAWELAQGHLALLQALLTALLAMLSRGGTARALAPHEIGANSRLGPAMARWLEEQEAPLRQALSQAGRRGEPDMARTLARAPAPAVTPAQLRAEAQEGRARAPGPALGPIQSPTGAAEGPVINAAGAARAAKYNAFQQGASLNDTVALIAGENPVVSYTASGKTIYRNPNTGLQVVYDNAGNYFRVENTNVTGPLRYTDQFGNPIPANVPLVKTSGTTETGVPSDVRNALTHFTNTDGKP